MTDFDRHVDEALAVANDTDPPGPRAGGRLRGSGAATGRDAWRKALAEHRKRKRNQRVYRPYDRDPYRRAVPGVRKPPDQEDT